MGYWEVFWVRFSNTGYCTAARKILEQVGDNLIFNLTIPFFGRNGEIECFQ